MPKNEAAGQHFRRKMAKILDEKCIQLWAKRTASLSQSVSTMRNRRRRRSCRFRVEAGDTTLSLRDKC